MPDKKLVKLVEKLERMDVEEAKGEIDRLGEQGYLIGYIETAYKRRSGIKFLDVPHVEIWRIEHKPSMTKSPIAMIAYRGKAFWANGKGAMAEILAKVPTFTAPQPSAQAEPSK